MLSFGIYAWWLVLIALVLLNAIAAAWWLQVSMRVKIVEDAVRRFQAEQDAAIAVLERGVPGLQASVDRLRRRSSEPAKTPPPGPYREITDDDAAQHDPRLVEAAHETGGAVFGGSAIGGSRARSRAELVAGSDVAAAKEIRQRGLERALKVACGVQPCRRIPLGQPNTLAGNRCGYPGCTKLEEEPCDGYRAVR